MVFWSGMVFAAAIAWCAVESGFLRTWILACNALVAVYLAVFAAPLVARSVPELHGTDYRYALALVLGAAAVMVLLQGLACILLRDVLAIEFPQIMDTLGAGIVGFLGGLLVWSFAALAISASPLSQTAAGRMLGLERSSQPSNLAYLCNTCDLVHSLLSSPDSGTAAAAVEAMFADLAGPLPENPPALDAAAEPQP